MARDLMRRRPGQNGCCGCSLAAIGGLTLLTGLSLWRWLGPSTRTAPR